MDVHVHDNKSNVGWRLFLHTHLMSSMTAKEKEGEREKGEWRTIVSVTAFHFYQMKETHLLSYG